MSQFIQIPSLLRSGELELLENLISRADFVDGKLTASLAAREVKNNLQLDPGDSTILEQIRSIINQALLQSPLFQIGALPDEIYPMLISKYGPGRYYGWHVDSPVMGNPAIRTDLAMTIFLSDPSTYQGGELVLQTAGGMVSFKPAKGDAILYPCQFLHCVNEVTSGERVAAVTWIQSHVKSPEQRQILFQLNQVHAMLHQRAPQSPEAQLLLQTHSNLFRMWAEI